MNVTREPIFLEILFLIFLVLKLTNYINWSWWWVTAPLWLPITFVFIGLFIYFSARALFNDSTNDKQKM